MVTLPRSFVRVSLYAVLCCASWARGDERPAPGTPAPSSSAPLKRYPWESDQDCAVRGRLAEPIPEIQFDTVPLEEAVARLGRLTGVNIVVNWSAMELVAIDPENEVTLNVKNTPAARVLELLLYEIGAGETDLDYVIRMGVVTISTREELSRHTVTQIYDCSDLLTVDSEKLTAEVRRVTEEALRQGLPTTDGRTTERVVRTVIDNARKRQSKELLELIQATVDPESWRNSGGNVGEIKLLNDRLVVTQTPNTQRIIFDILAGLHTRKSAPSTAPPPIGRSWTPVKP